VIGRLWHAACGGFRRADENAARAARLGREHIPRPRHADEPPGPQVGRGRAGLRRFVSGIRRRAHLRARCDLRRFPDDQGGGGGRQPVRSGSRRVGSTSGTPAPPALGDVKASVGGEREVIVDSPPGMFCPALEAARGCDAVLLVAEPAPFGCRRLLPRRVASACPAGPSSATVAGARHRPERSGGGKELPFSWTPPTSGAWPRRVQAGNSPCRWR